MAEVERTWFRRRFIGEQIEPIFFTEAVVALEAEIVIARNTAAAVNVDEPVSCWSRANRSTFGGSSYT